MLPNLSKSISTDLTRVQISREENYRSQIKLLRAYLDVSDTPENDFATQEDIKVSGSCGWLELREDFQTWRDESGDSLSEKHGHIPQFYWLSARPGAGKTVLAGHVITHLQSFRFDCAYYFFHHGNKSQQTLCGLIRSLAYQMACSNASIRELLNQLKDDGVILDKDDERSIWRKVFLGGIMQVIVLFDIYRLQNNPLSRQRFIGNNTG